MSMFIGSDGVIVQSRSAFLLLLQRPSKPPLQRPLQLPVPSVVSAMSSGRVASLATLAPPAPPLPQVVSGNVTWPPWRPGSGSEGPRGQRRCNDGGRQRFPGESAAHQQIRV